MVRLPAAPGAGRLVRRCGHHGGDRRRRWRPPRRVRRCHRGFADRFGHHAPVRDDHPLLPAGGHRRGDHHHRTDAAAGRGDVGDGRQPVCRDVRFAQNIGLAGLTFVIVLACPSSAARWCRGCRSCWPSCSAPSSPRSWAWPTSRPVGQGPVVAFPTPFAFGAPTFHVAAIISMLIVILVTLTETTADILAVGEIVGTKVDRKRIAAGLRADMASSAVSPDVRLVHPECLRPERRPGGDHQDQEQVRRRSRRRDPGRAGPASHPRSGRRRGPVPGAGRRRHRAVRLRRGQRHPYAVEGRATTTR